jgi:hypothetical protein
VPNRIPLRQQVRHEADILRCGSDVRFTPESGHSIAADYDWMAMRAAALELQQADELARSFAKSNTNRLIGSAADLIRSRDTSRSSP